MLNFCHLEIARFLHAWYHPKITGPILKSVKKNPTRDRTPNSGEGAAGAHGHIAVAAPPFGNYNFATEAFMESCFVLLSKTSKILLAATLL